MGLKAWASAVLDAVYPRLCEVCGRALVPGEVGMCLECAYNLPRINMHYMPMSPLQERLLDIHIPLDRVGSWFWYNTESPYAELIRSGKYRHKPSLIRYLTETYVNEIRPDGFFYGIDVVVPVPMHWAKRHRRGFNQSVVIAQTVSKMTGIPMVEHLRARRHSSQTRMSQKERRENVRGVYRAVNASSLAGKHVLIVDDILTTGATIHACMAAIAAEVPLLPSGRPDITISAMTLAATTFNNY